MKTKFSKLFVTILIVAAVTCCGALGVFAADDANADTAAATTAVITRTLSQLMPEKLPIDQLCRFTISASLANVTTKSVMAEQI